MRRLFLIGLAACLVVSIHNASATMVAYEALPASPSNHVSFHASGGPVLADDFASTLSGVVQSVEWWGAAPISASGTDLWELTFHTDVAGAPSTVNPTGVISQHVPVSATGTDLDGDGIFHFVAAWNPADMFVAANTSYWFSVANASGNGWTWANGAFPTAGFEFFDATVSNTAPGNPHFGPWTGLPGVDFAFRINLISEPATIALIGLGLIGVALAYRRRL